MKQHRAISLIETLISLTIVSLAIIALIPTVTVKNKGENYTYGNAIWKSNADNNAYVLANVTDKLLLGNNPYMCTGTNTPVKGCKVGTSYYNGTSDLLVDTTDFKNRTLEPLYVSGQLNKRGTIFKSSGSKLHFYSGTYDSTKNAYPMYLFVDSTEGSDRVSIDMSSVVDDYTINKGTYSVPNRVAIPNFYSLDVGNATSNGQGEQLFVAYNGDNNLVAVGRNAGKCFAVDAPNSIVILNGNITTTVCPPLSYSFGSSTEPGTSGLAIGKTALSGSDRNTNWNFNEKINQDFVIHKVGTGQDGTSAFRITANLVVPGQVTANVFYLGSDKRLKNIISEYKRGLKEILKIKPVEFVYKKDEKKQHHIGVIAQDLKKFIPEAVKVNSDKYYVVDNDPVFYALLNAVKELNDKNMKIEQENKNLEKKIAELKKIKARLQASQGGANE